MNGRLLTIEEVERETSLSRWTIRRKEREGRFPARKHLSANRVAWPEREVDRWKADPQGWAPEAPQS
jgi:predicted DNA-binding transcriptional regulator AlpA